MLEFFDQYFDLIFTGIAALLAVFSIKEYKLICKIVSLEFAGHIFVYYILYQSGILNNWSLYAGYAACQFMAMYFAKKSQYHIYIYSFLLINLTINLISLNFAYNHWESRLYTQEFISIYSVYEDLTRTIMIFELLYLGFLTRYVATHIRKYGDPNIDYIDSLFRVRCRLVAEGVA